MAICKNCGSALIEGARFCRKCGTAVQTEPKVCNYCGAVLREGARFCSVCGKEPFAPAITVTTATAAVAVCTYCGAQMRVGGKFCPKCGKESKASASPTPENTGALQREQETFSAVKELTGSISAVNSTGVMSIELPHMSAGSDNTVLGPIMTVTRSIGGFFKGLKGTLSDKRALITAVVTSAVWIGLWLWNRSSHANRVSDILSMLTFAEGGTRGTFGQILGGAFGKGMVISALMSLFGGEGKSVIGGFKQVFTRGGSIGLCLAGFGAAVVCYQLFAGYAGTYGVMVALSGAVMSLQALGGDSGFIGRMAKSLVARKVNGVRMAEGGRVKGLLTGAALGFAVSAALSAFYIPWWIGLIIAAIGVVLSLILDRKAVKA